MSSAVYERILKTTYDNDHISLAFNAVLNLSDKKEIQDFVADYKKFNPGCWKNDIAYAIEFFDDISHKQKWFEAVGDIIGISVLKNRTDRELYTRFRYVDKVGGKTIPNKVNTEKGTHQNKSRYHDILADLPANVLSDTL